MSKEWGGYPKQIFIDNNLYHDWEPSEIDMQVIRLRIEQKIKQKPDWYRKS